MSDARAPSAFELLSQLVAYDSTSCFSNVAVSEAIAQRLDDLGFDTTLSQYVDAAGVSKANVVAKLEPIRRSTGNAGLAYFCHSDVVPSADWSRNHSPFELTAESDKWFGRGSCDMKGSAVCMLEATSRIRRSDLNGPVYFVCTADEEVGFAGARHFATHGDLYRELVSQQTPAIIGEPTSLRVVHAHKGICGLRIVSKGRSAHSSSREGLNANLAMIPFLSRMLELRQQTLVESRWQHPEFDPPDVSWNIGINDFNYAPNITACQSVCTIFFRPTPNRDFSDLIQQVKSVATEFGLEFEVEMQSKPFYTEPDNAFVITASEIAGQEQAITVAYGTDGGELTGLENMIVLGPGDIAQAHTADEWIATEQIAMGIDMFEHFLRHFCCT